MNNHNFRARPRHRDIAFASDIGWADFRAGRPYPTAYDGWDRLIQRNYENGRLRAANHAYPVDTHTYKCYV